MSLQKVRACSGSGAGSRSGHESAADQTTRLQKIRALKSRDKEGLFTEEVCARRLPSEAAHTLLEAGRCCCVW